MPHVMFPDVSSFQAGLSLKGAPAVVARATEGDWLRDDAYEGFKAQAATLGIPFAAYHFLESGSSARAQAQFAYSVVGPHVPLMLDWEPIMGGGQSAASRAGHTCGSGWRSLCAWQNAQGGLTATPPTRAPFISRPGVEKALGFIRHYRALGGSCNALYHPHWYWEILGEPPLHKFKDLGMGLVSSNYTTYGAGGPGWGSYGGMAPEVWQFSDTFPFNGSKIDFNAYRGTVTGLEALWKEGTRPAHAFNPVGNLRVTHQGFTSISLAWDASPGATHYRVVAVSSAGKVKRNLQASGPELRVGRLSPFGHTYTIRVRAQPGGAGGKDAEITVKTR